MRIAPGDFLKFRQALATSDSRKRTELLSALGIAEQQARALGIPQERLYQTQGHSLELGSQNQDEDLLPDPVDPHPLAKDANQDLLTDGKDPRLDMIRTSTMMGA